MRHPTNIDFEWYAKEVLARLRVKPTKVKIEQLRRELQTMHSYGYKDCILHYDSTSDIGNFFRGFGNEE